MPELPEAETIRRSLEKLVIGKTIEQVWYSGLPLRSKKINITPIKNETIVEVKRWGKNIFLVGEKQNLLVNLGMSGKLLWNKKEKHTHVILVFKDGYLSFTDPRRFGYLHITRPYIPKEPPDPLLTKNWDLYNLSSKMVIKNLLLSGKRVIGIGNIYANEALWLAKISPFKKSSLLTKQEADRLKKAIIRVLKEAIKDRGTTLKDFCDCFGVKGTHQNNLYVYNRQGNNCLDCGTKIEKRYLSRRSTFFCPACQL